jgi:hypothetical protein
MADPVRRALATLADDMPPARLDGDTWRTGRRRRRRVRLVAAAAVMALVGAATVLPTLMPAGAPVLDTAADRGAVAVPATAHRPWPWQPRADDRPAGPALLALQARPGGWGEQEGVVADGTGVLVADGGYRVSDTDAASGEEFGLTALLSPDGRYLAGWDSLLDLVTGRRTALPARTAALPNDYRWRTVPSAWSADGSRLLVLWVPFGRESPVADPIPAVFGAVEIRTGSGTELGEAGVWYDDRELIAGAFSPDGRRVALGRPGRLSLVDPVDGSTDWSVPLDGGETVAGPAAWTPDGTGIVLHSGAVRAVTDGAARPAPAYRGGPQDVVWGYRFVDRLVGWRHGTEPVLQSGAALRVVHADGRDTVLLRAPAWAATLEVPRDLIESARFDGAAARPSVLPAPWWVGLTAGSVLLVLAAAGWWLLRRWRTRRLPRSEPGSRS